MYASLQYVVFFSIPVLLSIAHIVNAIYRPNLGVHKSDIRSFTAGFSVAYVFLLLLFEIAEFGRKAQINTSIYLLIGFTLFHVAHKVVFREKDLKKRAFLIDEVHLGTLSVYSLLITFFLIELTKVNILQGIITSGVIIIHTVLLEISQSETSPKYHKHLKSLSAVFFTCAGGALAMWHIVSYSVTIALLAITAGAIVYMAIREEIPSEKEDHSSMFLIGVIVMYILLSATPLY